MLTGVARMLRRRGIVAALLLAVGLSGCGQRGWLPWVQQNPDRAHQHAQAALARWAAAVEAAGGQQGFVPVGELTGQIGDWEEAVGDNNKRALMAGLVVAAMELPPEAPGEADVRWDNGTTKTVRTISAAQALQELRAAGAGDCPDCVPLQVTAAHLSRGTVQTSRGPASAPAWEFTLRGTQVVATRIAVAASDGITVTPLPGDPNDGPIGIWIESATGTVDGRQLTVSFVGAPRTGDKPCGADYTAEAVESDIAVVVIVTEHPNSFRGACTLEGAIRTATVDLAAPLGDRTLLEVDGLPVAVLLTP